MVYYRIVYKAAQEDGDKEQEARALYKMSTCFEPGKIIQSTDYDSQMHYKSMAIELLPSVNNLDLRRRIMDETAGLYYQIGEYEPAIYWWKETIRELDKYAVSRIWEPIQWNNLAGGYLGKGVLDSALYCLNFLLQKNPHCLDSGQYGAVTLWGTWSEYYVEAGDFSSAIRARRRAIKLAFMEKAHFTVITHHTNLLANLFATMHNYDSAYFYSQWSSHYKDSMAVVMREGDQSRKLIKASFGSEVSRYKAGINAAQASRAAGRRVLLVALSGLSLFILLSFVLYRSDMRGRQKNRMISEQATILESQNSTIEKSLVEKELLLREIHHRVKNNLQQINGLLSLQRSSISDPVAQLALKDSSARVSTIALIHQQLYQNESLLKVNLRRFSDQLFEQVSKLYQGSSKTVKLRNEIGLLELNADLSLPVSLILNELFTNSFKHAVPQVDHPEISLQLEGAGPDRYILKYQDNGPGLPPGFDYAASNTLGMRLLLNLSRQLKGNFRYEPEQNAFFISFQIKKDKDNI
jgi:two-component sensor histidine kinase